MQQFIDDEVEQFVQAYVADFQGSGVNLSREAKHPCGLTPQQMIGALGHPLLAQIENRPQGIQLMADFMAPEGSLYFDSIYGAFYGQKDIRGWLVPTMADISFIDFVPQQEPVLFDDGLGGTTVDEWQMFINPAAMGGEGQPIALSRGVSVRRYRDGFISWACDVYDTGPFRRPSPTGEVASLPEVPIVDWHVDRGVSEILVSAVDFDKDCDQFHPTDSVYLDPLFGDFHGQEKIRSWMMDVMGRVGNIVFEPLGPELNDGSTYLQEWQQMAILPDESRVFMFRGTSVRRFRDGHTVYAADYFDTASLMNPQILAASVKCGASLTSLDIAKYRLA